MKSWDNAPLDDFVGDFAARPLGNRSPSVFRSFTSEGHDLAALLGSDLDRAAGAWHVTKTLVQRKLGKGNGGEGEPAGAPEADGIDIKVEQAGDLRVVGAISSGEDDASAEGKLLRERTATQERLQVLAQLRRKLDGWRFWTSHGDNSQF